MIPDLASYDVVLVNSSGGKDSQAMLDWLVELAGAVGVLDRVVVVHADLGRTPRGHEIEWPGTPELAEEQASRYGLRFIKVARTQDDLLTHVQKHGMWPSSAARYCTSDHKRGPIRTVMTRLADEQRAAGVERRVRILNCMGMRRQESPARARKPEFVADGPASNKTRRQVDEWLPIIDWTVEQVWERIAASGVRHHPVYDTGMPRLSCSLCVLASRPALELAAQLRPELVDEYVDTEVAIGHRFTDKFSIAEIRDSARTNPRPVTVPDWSA